MNRERLFKHLEDHYIPKREMISRIPLGVQPDEFWQEYRPAEVRGEFELKNVDFSYDRKKIIDNVSLTIPEKATTAFVGPSGGGKTTLCHLMARFWDVQEGAVTLGGRNVKDYSFD